MADRLQLTRCMYKAMLLSFALAACTPADSSIQSASGGWCGSNDQICPDAGAPGPDAGEPPVGPTCLIDGSAVALDTQPANVDDSDGKVTFCHATSSATNPFVIITTSIAACTAHENHDKLPQGGEEDVFPTSGCED